MNVEQQLARIKNLFGVDCCLGEDYNLALCHVYYNRKRISTMNDGRWPPAIYREKVAAQEKAV